MAERFNVEIEWAENEKADFKIKCKQFVKVYSRIAVIIEYEMMEWEKIFCFLRYLIPSLKVDGLNGSHIRGLLDFVDLKFYGLRRTALKETIVLDVSETVVDPNKAVMVNAGGDDEEPKNPLDEILKEFNEKWFKAWETTPDDQKAKLVSLAKAVVGEDYQNLVVGDPDQQVV